MERIGGLRIGIVVLYGLAVVALMIATAGLSQMLSDLFFMVVALWAVSPVAALALLRRENAVTAIGAILIGVGGIFLYWRAFFGPDIDAQSGLVLFFLPFYQWAAGAIVVLFSYAFGLMNRQLHD